MTKHAIVVCALVLVACGSSRASRPPGSRGGDCTALGTCNEGLECVRGVCVPDGTEPVVDGATSPAVDGGPLVVLPDAGADTRADAGSSADAGARDSVLLSNLGALIDVFPVEAGLLIVDQRAARLVDPYGVELAKFEPGRQITSASFDGTYLAVADRATVTALRPDLSMVSSTTLTQYCESSVIVSGHRFVCGPENDWDRVFVTYDLTTGGELRSSSEYTYNGIPMKGVPGSDYFVTVTVSLSPSDFHLYEVTSDGQPSYLGESPYHGDFGVSDVYAFTGTGSDRQLVTHQGLLLDVMSADSSCHEGCFVRAGDIGVLPTDRRYIGLTEGGDGRIFGLADSGDAVFYGEERCASGCVIQHVDVPSRTLVGEGAYNQPFAHLKTIKHDPHRDDIVLGVHPDEEHTGYEIRRVSVGSL